MASIQDLRKSITELPDEEAFELVKQIRFARRAPLSTKTKATKRSPKKIDARSMINSMSPEQREELLKSLMED